MKNHTQLILESLRSAPLLIGDLPEAPVFDRQCLGKCPSSESLSFDQKLGHLYEQALCRLLEASDCLDLLASHLQVFSEGGRTLGELDFLLHDRARDRHIQLELAVKFYLAVPDVAGWQFPGPDPRDNWSRKLARLRQHQLQLSQLLETRALLSQRFGVESVEPQQLIYGCLFLPLAHTKAASFAQISPSARIGRWLSLHEWPQYLAAVSEVLLIPKPLWPVELTPQAKSQFQRIATADLHRLASERCTMFCLADSSTPYFLVPETWLNCLA